MRFGQLLLRERRAAGFTQQQLATRSTVSTGTIGNLENGRIVVPQEATLRLLADALPLDAARRETFLAAGRPRAVPLTLPNFETQLPSFRTRFFGQVEARTRVAALLRAASPAPLVTLTGHGGGGKTRLAIRVAEDLAADFPDGVWFADLAPLTDASLVVRAVSDAVGLRSQGDAPPLPALVAALRRRRLLLIIDNCEHLADACAALVVAVQRECHGVHILATSRTPLMVSGEQVYQVPLLALPADDDTMSPSAEALQLFLDRVALVAPTVAADPSILSPSLAICRHLGGLPLALELAAARAATLSVADIAAALPAGLALLSSGPRDLPSRQRSVEAALDWSYSLLTPTEQAVFRSIGVFAGTWTLAAAEAVCALIPIADGTIQDVVARLVHSSLIITVPVSDGPQRYRLLAPIRQYATMRLAASEEEARVSAQHYAWCISLAAQVAEPLQGGPATTAWLVALAQEERNLWAALHWARTGEPAGGLVLASLLWPYFFMHQGHSLGRDFLRASLAAAPAPTLARAHALYGLGVLLLFADTRAAQVHLTEALTLATTLGANTLAAELQWPLAFISLVAGDLAGARARLATWWAWYGPAPALGQRCLHAMLRGYIALASGDLAAGRRELAAAYADAVAVDQPLYQCLCLTRLGAASLKRGLPQEALAEFVAMREAAVRLGSTFYQTIATLRIGMAHEWLGDLAAAEVAYTEALALNALTGGNPLEQASGLIGLGRVAVYRQQPATALVPLQAAAVLLAPLGHRPLDSDLAYPLGLALWQGGQRAAGATELLRALDLRAKNPDRTVLAQYLEGLAALAVQEQEVALAADWLGAAAALREEAGTPSPLVDLAQSNATRATIAATHNPDALAVVLRDEALTLAEVTASVSAWLKEV